VRYIPGPVIAVALTWMTIPGGTTMDLELVNVTVLPPWLEKISRASLIRRIGERRTVPA